MIKKRPETKGLEKKEEEKGKGHPRHCCPEDYGFDLLPNGKRDEKKKIDWENYFCSVD